MSSRVYFGKILSFEDTNNNGGLDSSEFLESEKSELVFKLVKKFSEDTYLLVKTDTCFNTEESLSPEESLGSQVVYSKEHGFLLKGPRSSNGQAQSFFTGIFWKDPSRYDSDITASFNQDALNHAPSPLDWQQLIQAKSEMSDRLKNILNDPTLLSLSGVSSVEALYKKFEILTEGELLMHPEVPHAEEAYVTLSGHPMAVSFKRDGGRGGIFFNHWLLEKAMPGQPEAAQWSEAIRSVFYHEVTHLNSPYMDVDIKQPTGVYFKLRDELSKPFSFPASVVLPPGTPTPDKQSIELARLYDRPENLAFKGYYDATYERTSNTQLSALFAFSRCLEESRSYALQLAQMKDPAKYPGEFLDEIILAASHYFDALKIFTEFSEGKDAVKKILKPFLNSPWVDRVLDVARDRNVLEQIFASARSD